MKATKTKNNKKVISYSFLMFLMLLGLVVLLSPKAYSLPSGAEITHNSTAGTPFSTPGNRTDPRGTITTLVLDATQQVQTWKGYVGNVTGALSLKDSSDYTLYDWDLTGVTITGQVYSTRNSSVDFSSVSCVSTPTVNSEDTFNNLSSTQTDNINNTFNYQNHTSFYVGTHQITANSCKSTATYINSTAQTVNETADFQEVLLEDSGNNLIYTTLIEDNVNGYNLNPYDFQMIVAESPLKSTPTTYYFFTEISS